VKAPPYNETGGPDEEITMELNYDDAVAFVSSFVQADPLHRPVHLVGHSMGGFAIQKIGARRPELVKSLTLIGTSSDPESGETKSLEKQFFGWFVHWFGINRFIIRSLLEIFFDESFPREQPLEAQYWEDFFMRNSHNSLFRSLQGVWDRPDTTHLMAKIVAPTLIIHGQNDKAINIELARKLHENIVGSEIMVVQNAGHQVPQEKPDLVITRMKEFLLKVEGQSL